MKLKFAILAGTAMMLMASCDKGYRIEGTVEGAGADTFVGLERSDAAGGWISLDSVELKEGKFAFKGERPAAPEIFRLRYGGEYIYLPVDSTETVTVTANAHTFATSYKLTGSTDAEQMERFEKKLLALGENVPAEVLEQFKKEVYSEFIQSSQGSIVSYYVLTKTLGGRPLYGEDSDYRYYAAVANAYKHFRPDDPRTPFLERIGLEGLRKHNSEKGKQRVVEAQEVAMLEVSLPDESGTVRTLSSVTGRGRKSVLAFSNMLGGNDPAINMELRKIASEGVEIYQVSFDGDRYQWRRAAANLPWVTVWAGEPTSASKVVTDYNVGGVPTFFIFDSTGHLLDRAAGIGELRTKLNKAN